MNQLRSTGEAIPSAWNPPPIISIGEVTQCIDYASQPLTVGSAHRVGLDFGDQLSMNDHQRTALSDPEKKRERSQCAILHLAAAYYWYIQGRPRRPHAASRVQTAAQKIRQSEYHEASRCRKEAGNRNKHRDYEIPAELHDVVNAHRDMGFEGLNSPHRRNIRPIQYLLSSGRNLYDYVSAKSSGIGGIGQLRDH